MDSENEEKIKKDSIYNLLSAKTSKFFHSTELLLKFTIGIMLIIHATVGIIAPIQAYNTNYITEFSLTTILVKNLFFISAYIFTLSSTKNRFGNLILWVMIYFSFEELSNVLEQLSSFTLAQAFWGIIILLMGLAFLISFFRMVVLTIVYFKHKIYFIKKIKEKILAMSRVSAILFLVCFSFMVGHLFTISRSFEKKVTLSPQDYDIKFRMWGMTSPKYYQTHPNGTQILKQLDKHEVILQNMIFSIRDADGQYESFSPTVYAQDIEKVVSNLTWFNDNYPGIKFQYYAYGIGFGSNGNYEGSIYTTPMLKRFVDICRNYSLPNVVGVYTDWEGPGDAGRNYSSMTQNGWHQAQWTEAFAYVRAYFPNWTLSCCYPESVTWDHFDGDDDLQYFSRYNIFTPEWDDYGPMAYRGGDRYSVDPDTYNTPWYLYGTTYALVNGAFQGDPSKATMWIGCIGTGPYRNDSISYDNHDPIDFGDGMGFDGLARDILLLKHFGLPTVSLFVASSTADQHGPLPGFFDQYGFNDSLDRLNESVNGVGSTTQFSINANGAFVPDREIIKDFQLNFNQLIYVLVMLGYFTTGLIFMQFNKMRVKFNLGKRESKGQVKEDQS
jgi:hypothetical protein